MKNTTLYRNIKNSLFEINDAVSRILADLKSLPEFSEKPFLKWEQSCDRIYRQISEEVVRVAVVGTIKSGKSTFVNALFKGDYVKRGAGVITSIVTKIRSGSSEKAKLYFKSWDEVNKDMEQAMVLFPHFDKPEGPQHFDIRRTKDRNGVSEALDSLGTDTLFSKDARNTNSVLLSCYLRGYDRVRDLLSSDPVTKVYHGRHFEQHRDFVGDQTMAVYLKDVHLEIENSRFEKNLEIADCQGSDSPNPLHITMIQDYLSTTHLIIYIISSRTGLRDADIRFLSMIRRMGILENTLFVVNCDLNEHESLQDFKRVLSTVKDELSLLIAEPKLYGFSALFNLFDSEVDRLSGKDKSKLAQWLMDDALLSFSKQETERFEASFSQKMNTERYSTLIINHVKRLRIIVSGIDHWLGLHRDILMQDTMSASAVISNIKDHLIRTNQIKSTIQSALDGAVQKLKKELKDDTDRFFDPRSGPIVHRIIKFTKDYQISYNEREQQLNVSGFTNSMYNLFLDLKHVLDTYIVEKINPEVIRFFKELEQRIKTRLEAIVEPYDIMAHNAFLEYKSVLMSCGMPNRSEKPERVSLTDIQQVKEIAGIHPPSATISLRYSARVKTEAVMHFSIYSITNLLEKLMKRSIVDNNKKEMRAYKKGVLSLKREMIHSIMSHFRDYQENIKFQYIFKLVEAAAKDLFSNLTECFENDLSSLSSMSRQMNRTQTDKESFLIKINECQSTLKDLSKKIDGLTEKITITDQ